MSKITEKTALAVTPASGDLLAIVDVSDTTQASSGTTKKISASILGLDAKRYVALLTQSGTSAPVATVLENTLGGTVVMGYTSASIFTATLTAAFTVSKTAARLSYGENTGSSAVPYASRTSDNVITFGLIGAGSGGLLTNALFTILIYP